MSLITCKNCSTEIDRSASRQWKAERYCKTCYKKVSKQERELMSIAAGF